MKRKSQAIKLWITVLAVLLIGSLSFASVYAQDYDSNRKGSITINLIELDTEFSGVAFTCYKVADVGTGVTLVWDIAPELAAVPLNLNELKTAEDYQEAASLLASEIGNTSITGQQVATDASGKAVFPSLEQGVYLLVQTDQASYGTVEPFLIGIPYTENGSEWVYDVQTETKGEPLPKEQKQDKKEDKTEPKTGDSNDIAGWMVIMVCSGVAVILSATFWYKRRKKDNQ